MLKLSEGAAGYDGALFLLYDVASCLLYDATVFLLYDATICLICDATIVVCLLVSLFSLSLSSFHPSLRGFLNSPLAPDLLVFLRPCLPVQRC